MNTHKPSVRRRLLVGAASTAVLMTAAGTALGQTPPAASDDPIAVEEIVVTARSREERLLDVPDTITAFGQAGLKVMITELDVDVLPARGHNTSADVSRNEAADPALNPYTDGLPANVQEALARRYAELFAVYLKHPGVVTRVTLWGLCDGESWLNDWPIRGRTSHPLLFDRACKPKPAFQALVAPRR